MLIITFILKPKNEDDVEYLVNILVKQANGNHILSFLLNFL